MTWSCWMIKLVAMSEKPEIDLDKYRQHKRNVPWGLIRKIIIGTALILLIFYFMNQMKKEQTQKEETLNEIEVDIED